jgi:surfactin synthase thioesterase subunit
MPRSLFHSPRTVFLFLALAFALALLYRYYAENPLDFLMPPQHDAPANVGTPVLMEGRKLQHITLKGGRLGDIGIIVSLPEPLPAGKLPILFVLGGLGSGEDNISFIKDAGANVIVGYDWPIPVRFPTGAAFLIQMPELYDRVATIPGQIATAIGWLAGQPWADDNRISLLGFSLGALAAPAAENLAEHDGHPIGWTIIAYGGAPLGALFADNPHMKPAAMRAIVGPLLDVLLRPFEPTANLPQLSGHFLVLEGRDDTLMPEAARNRLREAVPQPKDVIVFNGAHMGVGPGKMELLDEIIRTSRTWLAANGATNSR